MTGYRVPARTGVSLLEVKGSLFYGRAVRVDDEVGVQALLASARASHPEASHHAFAYRLGASAEIARFGDDGEPGGTAGRPMMEVLIREGLVYAAVVVSRHFGGNLLGAGGLLRAYGGTAAAAARAAGVSVMHPHVKVRIVVDYDVLGALQQEIRRRGLSPPLEDFGGQVTSVVTVPTEEADAFGARVNDLSSGRAIVDVLETVYQPLRTSEQ